MFRSKNPTAHCGNQSTILLVEAQRLPSICVFYDNISTITSQREFFLKTQKMKFPKNSPNIRINWGIIGDGDKLEIGEFSLKNPQKLGWRWGRHFWGKSGTNWGQGQI